MNRLIRHTLVGVSLLACLAGAREAEAQESPQTGRRVSLPEGPGSIEGIGENADVDNNMGLLAYRVPISIPSGQAELMPGLSLAYQSGGGNGLVGIGWSLSLPSIDRMTSRGLPRYDRSDAIAADGGQELVEVDRTRGVFRARYEGGFVRYTWIAAGSGAAGTWRAEYPDGRVAYFGADEQGTAAPSSVLEGSGGVFSWRIVAMTDPRGHVVRYRWRRVGGVPVPEAIEYGGGASVPRYAARFTYEDRPDPLSDAKPGVETRLTVRLRGIQVLVFGAQQRRYELTYEGVERSGGSSRLSRVETFGNNDLALYPVRFGFNYSPALPCPGEGCSEPQLRRLGSIGADLRAGTSDFVDIDGDAVPDALSTTGGTHQIQRGRFAADGTQSFSAATPSAVARGGASALGPRVQLLDWNGDGFVDLVDGAGSRVYLNRGSGDWQSPQSVADANLRDFTQDAELRFFDYDGDRRPDLIHSEPGATWYFLRGADHRFAPRETLGESPGWSFSRDGLRLVDINGDGLDDAVLLLEGVVAYRLHLGRGRWAPRQEMSGVPSGLQLALTQLADVNADGLPDLVAVEGDRVRYALNQGGTRFGVLREIRASAALPIPVRTSETTFRLSDMNGNGSTDLVWVDPSGSVTVVDLYPKRPNLLTRITNGIGRVTDIVYATSVDQLTRDGGPMAWRNRVPFSMQVVDRVVDTDTFSGVSQRRDYRYHHGYWDGEESQFRGFEEVEILRTGDSSSEAGREVQRWDVGAADRYRKGLLLSKTIESGGRVLSVETHTFSACPLEEVPTTAIPVQWYCERQLRRVVQEGAPASQHLQLGEDYRYDGYGNRTAVVKHGVMTQGGAACEACNRDASIYGLPCGPQCLGDESVEETEYVSPARAGGRWILRKPSVQRRRGREGDSTFSEARYFYDGPAFRGLPGGELVRGDVTRVTNRLEGDGGGFRVVEVVRNRFDTHGNVLETIDANGHRRTFTYDDDGVLARSETIHFDDRPSPYRLVMEVEYHPVHEKITARHDWRVEGRPATELRHITRWAYDAFGRVVARARPGESLEDPTERWRYELSAPVSRIVHVARTRTDSPDIEDVQCFDGAGRALGKRTRVGAARWMVQDWVAYDVQGHVAQRLRPFEDPSGVCASPTAPTRGQTFGYDATGREIRARHWDGSAYGTDSVTSHRYLPLRDVQLDEEDSDPMGVHRDTPTTVVRDGMDRIVAIDRTLGTPVRTLRLELRYDSLGRTRGYVDPEGVERVQRWDLMGRVVEVVDRDAGRSVRSYDDVGNLLRRTDARGTSVMRAYDEANRIVAHWDEARPQQTRVGFTYDLGADCVATRCSNPAARLVSVSYPLGNRGVGVDRFGYDMEGRELLRERSLNGVAFEVATERDAMGRELVRRFQNRVSFRFLRDGLGRVSAVPGYVPSIEYGDDGEMRRMLYANGVETLQEHHVRGWLNAQTVTGPTGRLLQAIRYTRDRVGNPLEAVDRVAEEGEPSLNARHRYDDLYRLIGTTHDPGRFGEETVTWRYDDGDDVTEVTSSLGDRSPAHVGTIQYGDGMTAGPHSVVLAGTDPYRSDATGNVTQRGQQTLSWDHLGRLTQVRRGEEVLLESIAGPSRLTAARIEGARVSIVVDRDFQIEDGIGIACLRIVDRCLANVHIDGLAPQVLPDAGAPGENGSDQRTTAGDAWASIQATRSERTPGALRGATADQLLRASAAQIAEESLGVEFVVVDQVGTQTLLLDARGGALSRDLRFAYGTRRWQEGATERSPGLAGSREEPTVDVADFGVRRLDSRLGLWISADPISEVYEESMMSMLARRRTLPERSSDREHVWSGEVEIRANRFRFVADYDDVHDATIEDDGALIRVVGRSAELCSFMNRPTYIEDFDGADAADLAWTGAKTVVIGVVGLVFSIPAFDPALAAASWNAVKVGMDGVAAGIASASGF